jgi:hypothetical protein
MRGDGDGMAGTGVLLRPTTMWLLRYPPPPEVRMFEDCSWRLESAQCRHWPKGERLDNYISE